MCCTSLSNGRDTTMDVLICTAKEQNEWRDALAECLPEARVHVGFDAPACDYAVVWRPPAQVFEQQRHLKALRQPGLALHAVARRALATFYSSASQ